MIVLIILALFIVPTFSTKLDGGIAPVNCSTPSLIFESIYSQFNHTNSHETYLDYTETIHFTDNVLNQEVFSSAKKPFIILSIESEHDTITLTSNITLNLITPNMSMVYIQGSGKRIDCNGFSFVLQGYSRIVFSDLTFINGHPAILLRESIGSTHACNVTFDGMHKNTNSSGIHLVCSSLYLYTCTFTRYLTTFYTDKMHNRLEDRTAPFDHYNDSISGGALTGILWHSNYKAVISIRDCVFSDNEVRNRTLGHGESTLVSWSTGGAIFLMFQNHTVNNTVQVLHTNFTGNTAGAIGGGLFVTFHQNAANNSIIVNDSLFFNNKAFVHSGGMGVYHDGFSINNGIYLNRVQFIRNYCFRAGGGFNVEYNFDYPRAVENFSEFTLDYPSFTTFPTPIFLLECMFRDNNSTLDAAAFQAWAFVSYLIHPSAVVLENCTFENNHASGYAAILASGVTLIFKGKTKIYNNSNSGLYLTHASTQFTGSIEFIDNVNHNPSSGGGGLRLYDGSYVYIDLNTEMIYIRNIASHGPAIYIDTGVLHNADYNVFFESDCSMLAVNYNETVIPTLGENIFFYFEGNLARTHEGRIRQPNYPMFMTNLDDCIPGRLDSLQEPDGEIPDKEINVTVTLGNIRLLKRFLYKFIETDPSQLQMVNPKQIRGEVLSGYPGKQIMIPPLKALDQLGTRTKATLFLQSDFVHDIAVFPDILVIERNVTITNLMFWLLTPGFNQNVTLTLTAVTSSYQLEHTMTLVIESCPEYMVLKQDDKYGTYGCELYQLTSNPLFLTYDDVNAKAYIKDGSWMSFVTIPNCNDTVLHGPCYKIFLGYCSSGFCQCQGDKNSVYPGCQVNVNKKYIDDQCHINREGIYCGICKPGKSVGLKSFECRECDPIKKVVGTIVAAIDLLIIILFCISVLWWNISYPPELAGVIFYIQTVALVYNANTNGWVIFQFFWLPLKYYSNSGFLKTILDPCTPFQDFKVIYSIIYQLNDFITMALILTIFYLLTHYMKPLYNHNFLNGFVFLLIFIYVTFAQVSFYFFNLEYSPTGEPVFGLQTDIPYSYVAPFGAIFGLLVLLVPILFVISAYGRFARIQLLTDVLRAPYKPHLWYWTGVDLLRRLLIVIVIIITTAQRPYRKIAICVAVLVILVAHVIAQPYKKKWVNIVEAFVLYDLFVISALNLDLNLATEHVYGLDLIMLVLPYFYAICYITYRVHRVISRKWKCPNFLQKRLPEAKVRNETLGQPLLVDGVFETTLELKTRGERTAKETIN